MNRLYIFILLFTLVNGSIFAQTATPPAAGDGSSGSPYQIATLENLYWLSQNIGEWSKDFIQTSNIDASGTAAWDDGNGGDAEGFSPIGNLSTQFTGVYNGDNYAISNLFIYRPSTVYVGMFGKTNSGTILQKIKLVEANVSGSESVGILVGFFEYGTIYGCASSGSISASIDFLGGLIGKAIQATCLISDSYSIATVVGSSTCDNIGGLIGYFAEGTIENCYARGNVTGNQFVGGLVGNNYIGTINNCYSTGSVEVASFHGGLVGSGVNPITTNSFWDTQTSGITTSNGGVGKTTAEMLTLSTFTNATWDFEGETTNGTDDIWGMYNFYNDGSPILLQGITILPPGLETNEASDITTTSATLNGNILNFGNSAPTQYGFVWSTAPSPTLADNKSEQGIPSATGTYTYSLNNLNPGTLYYIKSYATNNEGTGYGEELTFITMPANGDGSEANPYQIPNLTTLRWLSENSTHWDKYYLQTADIDASETATWNLGDHDNNAGTADEYMGFSPIGNVTTAFSGTYNGQGYTIDDLTINRPAQDDVGLFGYCSSNNDISDIHLNNLSIIGDNTVGGLCGNSNSNTIISFIGCSVSGNIMGTNGISGLIGLTKNTNIRSCYSNVSITGNLFVGGLVGYNRQTTIVESFSTGSVTCTASDIGGLVGVNEGGALQNCYSLASVVCALQYGGGLVGSNYGTVEYCYSKGHITPGSLGNCGGLIGRSAGGVCTNSFWDTQTSGQSTSAGGTGKTTIQMNTESTFTDAGWDFEGETVNGTNDIWGIYSYQNNGYPILLESTPLPPAIETNATSAIASTSATLNGNIIDFGNDTPTQHGFVWSTTTNPTVDNNKSQQGVPSATGVYTYNLSGLWPEVTYYVRAYATNSDGTAYGNEINFTSSANSDPVYIDYNIRSDRYYANSPSEFGYPDPSWRIRGKVSSSTGSGTWSAWDHHIQWNANCANGSWFDIGLTELWNGTVLNNADNVYIGIEGWEHQTAPTEEYNGSDYAYANDTDTDNDLSANPRGVWTDFVNSESGNYNYADCDGTAANSNDVKRVEFDLFWNYSIPVNPQFSLSDAETSSFTLNITGYSNYRVTSWDYQVSDDAGFSNIVASATGIDEYGVLDISDLSSGTTFYVRIKGTNEVGTGAYTSSQNITTKGINTWDGSESTDWNTAENWSIGMIPAPDDYVIIPVTTNNPQINSGTGASCIDLTVESGATLSVNSGGSLITIGNITNNGTINMNHNVDDGEWHLISIPTAGITAENFLLDYLQLWDETVPEWTDITDPEAPLNTNIGYALWATGSKSSYTFTGTPLTGEQSAAITLSDNFSTDEGNDGANLLGNPYPSSIDWSGLDDTWGAVYYWDPSANSGAGDYIEWNNNVGSGSQFIPPMQGFFIVATESNTTEGTGTFTLNNVNRTHSGAIGYYKSKIQNGIVLEARNGNLVDEVFIMFKDEATPAFDLQSDALKFLSGAEGIAQIYTFGENRKLAIDTRPACETIQLGFENETTGFYTIVATEIDGITTAILEDTKENIFHDLTQSDYSFNWSLNDDETRFKLHLNTTAIEETDINTLKVFVSGGMINISSNTPTERIILSNITGQILSIYEGSESIPAPKTAGVYLVSIENDGQRITQKIIVN